MPVSPDHNEADHRLLIDLKRTVDRILEQTTQTNGKVRGLRADVDSHTGELQAVALEVTAIDHALTGDPNKRTPSGGPDRGLAGKVYDQGEVVAQAKQMITALRVTGGLVATAAVGLLGNLAAGLLG